LSPIENAAELVSESSDNAVERELERGYRAIADRFSPTSVTVTVIPKRKA